MHCCRWGKGAHFIPLLLMSRLQAVGNRAVGREGRSQIERLDGRHHNYAHIENRLLRACLIRLGMQIDGKREEPDSKHTNECNQLCSRSRIPVSALHGTLVECNPYAKWLRRLSH